MENEKEMKEEYLDQEGVEEDRVYVTIVFSNKTREQMEHIYKAEKHLHEAGIFFDLGGIHEIGYRDWEFDSSLEGAIVIKVGKPGGEGDSISYQGENILGVI